MTCRKLIYLVYLYMICTLLASGQYTAPRIRVDTLAARNIKIIIGDTTTFLKSVGIGGATIDSQLTVNQGGHFKRGLLIEGTLGVGTGDKFQLNSSGTIKRIDSINTEGLFGVSAIVDTVEKTGQVATFSATNLNGTTIAGFYQIDYYGACTTANGTSTVTITIDWDNNTKSFTSTSFSNASVNNYVQGTIPIRNVPVSASAIRYSATVSGTIGTAVFVVNVAAKRID